MSKTCSFLYSLKSLFFACAMTGAATLSAQPSPALIGYFHNWQSASSPYIQLNAIDSRYNVIDIAFAIPASGTDYNMTFAPDQVTTAAFISQINTLKSQGKTVLISIGGANATVSLDNAAERNTFVSSMTTIINTYGFDGIDIDLEGSSVSVSGGTIAVPTDAKIINLIAAVKQIMVNYRTNFNKKMVLTMAPETAFVQGGQSAYGGIWGAYLPVIQGLKDSLDILHTQLYNSGSMYGIDGGIYSQGTADFVVAMTEAVIKGFSTAGGLFSGLPASKVAVGLPACTSAAGGGYIAPAVVQSAINYLRGTGPKPGVYALRQAGGYPMLRGMMDWSINWDAVATCNGAYSYANTFQTIFSTPPLGIELLDFVGKSNESQNQLFWQTASELNSDYFEVEKSENGIDFEKINTQKAANNSTELKNYTAIDARPFTHKTYYRLQEVDLDGTRTSSEIICVVTRTDKKAFDLFPNPALGSVNLHFYQVNSGNSSAFIRITNTLGAVVMRQEISIENGNCSLDVSQLHSGIYQIQVIDISSNNTQVQQLFIK